MGWRCAKASGRARAREHGRARLGRAGDRGRDRRRRWRQRDHREGHRARHRHQLRRRLRGERQVPDAAAASATRGGSCSSSPTFRAGTRGCSRRATTRTSGSAAGRARGRSCASTARAPARPTGSTRTPSTSLRGHRLPLRRPGTRIAGERALLVGDAAGLIDPVSGDGMFECFVSSRLAAAAVVDLLAGRARRSVLRRGRRRGARAAPPRLLEAEEGARPLAAGLLADRPLEAPLGHHPRDARRRAARSEQAARPRPRAAARARDPRALRPPGLSALSRTGPTVPIERANGGRFREGRSLRRCGSTRQSRARASKRVRKRADRHVRGEPGRALPRGERCTLPAPRLLAERALVGLNMFDLTHADDQRAARDNWRRADRGRPAERRRPSCATSAATPATIWVAITSTMLRDAAGSPLYAVSQTEDISPRRRGRGRAARDGEALQRPVRALERHDLHPRPRPGS